MAFDGGDSKELFLRGKKLLILYHQLGNIKFVFFHDDIFKSDIYFIVTA